jgi:hypothetical protein
MWPNAAFKYGHFAKKKGKKPIIMAYTVKKTMEIMNSTSIELSSIFNSLLIIASHKNFSAIFIYAEL